MVFQGFKYPPLKEDRFHRQRCDNGIIINCFLWERTFSTVWLIFFHNPESTQRTFACVLSSSAQVWPIITLSLVWHQVKTENRTSSKKMLPSSCQKGIIMSARLSARGCVNVWPHVTCHYGIYTYFILAWLLNSHSCRPDNKSFFCANWSLAYNCFVNIVIITFPYPMHAFASLLRAKWEEFDTTVMSVGLQRARASRWLAS